MCTNKAWCLCHQGRRAVGASICQFTQLAGEPRRINIGNAKSALKLVRDDLREAAISSIAIEVTIAFG